MMQLLTYCNNFIVTFHLYKCIESSDAFLKGSATPDYVMVMLVLLQVHSSHAFLNKRNFAIIK